MIIEMLEWLIVIAAVVAITAFIIMMYKSIAAENDSATTKILVVLGSICLVIGGFAIDPHFQRNPSALRNFGSLGQDILSAVGASVSIIIIWRILRQRTNDDLQNNTVKKSGPDWMSWIGFEVWWAQIDILFLIVMGIVSVGMFIYRHFILMP